MKVNPDTQAKLAVAQASLGVERIHDLTQGPADPLSVVTGRAASAGALNPALAGTPGAGPASLTPAAPPGVSLALSPAAQQLLAQPASPAALQWVQQALQSATGQAQPAALPLPLAPPTLPPQAGATPLASQAPLLYTPHLAHLPGRAEASPAAPLSVPPNPRPASADAALPAPARLAPPDSGRGLLPALLALGAPAPAATTGPAPGGVLLQWRGTALTRDGQQVACMVQLLAPEGEAPEALVALVQRLGAPAGAATAAAGPATLAFNGLARELRPAAFELPLEPPSPTGPAPGAPGLTPGAEPVATRLLGLLLPERAGAATYSAPAHPPLPSDAWPLLAQLAQRAATPAPLGLLGPGTTACQDAACPHAGRAPCPQPGCRHEATPPGLPGPPPHGPEP